MVELAHKAKVGERTLRRMESPEPQPSVYDSTLRNLAAVLRCTRDDLAEWISEVGEDLAAPTHAAPAASATPDEEGDGPRASTLTRRAQIERELGKHAETVALPSGTFPVLGLDAWKECAARYVDMCEQTFVVMGRVKDYKPIPTRAADTLKAERGRGASYFLVTRNIRGITPDGKAKATAFYTTVFAPKGEHGRVLIRCSQDKTPVTLLVRIVVREPEADWKGFFIFEKTPKPWPWALVVQEILPSHGFGWTSDPSPLPDSD